MIDKQTEAMIIMSNQDGYICCGKHKETEKFHGILYVNHKTPSGCDRFMIALTTKDGYETEEEAINVIIESEKLENRIWKIVR